MEPWKPQLDRCRCPDRSGSCDYCLARFHGEIDEQGNLTEYGKSLIVADVITIQEIPNAT